jgi:hypothetical protein
MTNIDEDYDILKKSHFSSYYGRKDYTQDALKPAQVTYFKSGGCVELFPTHFNHWYQELEISNNSLKHEIIISPDKYERKINVLKNLTIEINRSKNCPFKTIDIINLSLKIGSVTIFSMDGVALNCLIDREFIGDNYVMIPIQQLIFNRDRYFNFTKNLNWEITIESHNPTDVKIYSEVVCLTECERKSFHLLDQEINFYHYHVKKINKGDLADYIQFPISLPVSEIIISDNADSASMDFMKFMRGNSKYLQFLKKQTPQRKFPPNNKSFYLSCYIEEGNDVIAGKYYIENKKIYIHSSSCDPIYVIIKCANTLLMNSYKISFGSSILPIDVNQLNNYPLTKVSDKCYIEGYWATIGYGYDLSYPWPKPGDQQVNQDFLDRLEELKNESEVTSSFGFSTCRLCGKNNGGDEYRVTKNDITFLIPEGLVHYYEDHLVQPSEEFYNFVMCN